VFARVHTVETSPEQHDRGLEIVRDQILPWLRDSSGFRGMIRLTDRAGGKTLVITLWADEETLRASAASSEQMGSLTISTTGATRLALEEYDVTFFDVEV
jgi:heme-degrading monooxygenase HmoA